VLIWAEEQAGTMAPPNVVAGPRHEAPQGLRFSVGGMRIDVSAPTATKRPSLATESQYSHRRHLYA